MNRSYLLLVLLLAALPLSARAQDPTGPSAAEASRGITNSIRDYQGAIEAASRAMIANLPGSTNSFWDTAAGQRQYLRFRQGQFEDALERFDRLVVDPWPGSEEELAVDVFQEGIRETSREVESSVSDMLEFIEWRLSVDFDEFEATLSELIDQRVDFPRLQIMAREVRPKIAELMAGDTLDIALLSGVVESLIEVRVLARSLRE